MLSIGGELYYCGFGLGTEVADNQLSVSSLSRVRHLYSATEEELLGATLHAGLHYLALSTKKGFLVPVMVRFDQCVLKSFAKCCMHVLAHMHAYINMQLE